jgi:hypothetical protein
LTVSKDDKGVSEEAAWNKKSSLLVIETDNEGLELS